MTETIGSKASKPNPALKLFEAVIGDWRTAGAHPLIPATELHGRTLFEWFEGGAFVLMRTEVDDPQIPDGLAIFGSDDQAGAYYMVYFDERGISRKYDVSITQNRLAWRRDDAHFSQRVTMDIEQDKLVSHGQMSRDGGDWEEDLSLTYMRK